MTQSTEELIATLAADLKPVRRLRPPMVRAIIWLATVAVVSGAAILLFADLKTAAARFQHARVAVEVLSTLLTGVAGVVAAFHLSLPDRSRAWALLPLPAAVAWLAASGLGCWQAWIARGPTGLKAGQSLHCFVLIVAMSVPVAGFLLWSLAKSRPLQPVSTASVGGLGAAALCAFLLQFFHPFEVTLVDLAYHLAAVGLVVSVASVLGRRALAR
jgi:hypothetical protein